MQYDVNNGLLQVVIEGEEINAVVGEAAQIDVGEAINYIQSGKAEIEEAVGEGITQFNGNATEKTNEFDLNAQNKTSDFNSNATQKTLDFNSNASDKTSEFNLNAQDKTGDFNDNAVDKTNDFNDNATVKTIAFNENATSKTTAFNENASEKQALVDASAQAASQSAAEAKQWAIGDPSEPTGNSAKYWAEQSAGALSGLTTRVSTIEGKIPSAASSSNQLADKDWVENKGYITGITSGDVTTALGYTPYDSSNPDGYQTASDVVTAISGKQDTLVSGTNIKTINNNSILGSGNLDINGLPTQTGQSGKFLTTDGTDASWADVDALPSQTGQSGKYLTTDGSSASWATLSVNPDNKSITTNSSSQLQTVGVINSRDTSTAVKTWTGTKAQYDAIVTKDPNTLYNITDDTDVSLTILEALYPVGSVYITTANTCPLSALISGSTWALRSSGVVTSVNTNVPVKGNGIGLGLTDGTNNATVFSTTNGNVSYAYCPSQNYGATTGSPWNQGSGSMGHDKVIGITTDSSKSGIVGTVTRSILSVNIFERTA